MKTYEERMASVELKLERKKKERKALAVTACTLCLCILAGIFLPPFGNPSNPIDKYADDPYYKVIEAINRDILPAYSNLTYGDMVWNEDIDEDAFLDVDFSAQIKPEASLTQSTVTDPTENGSAEITDHQVAGVLEADIIKRSQTHIFYFKGDTLGVYPIAGEKTTRVAKWKLPREEGCYYFDAEMYLSADAARITLIVSGSGKVLDENRSEAFTQLISLDVSDPLNIKEIETVYIAGSKLSVRLVGEQLLVMNQYRIYGREIDLDEPATFLPRYGTVDEPVFVAPEDIIVPDKLQNGNYTVVTMLDSRDLSVIDSMALMSYADTFYVSGERIYATRSYSAQETLWTNENREMRRSKTMTEVSCIAYDTQGLELAGSFAVEGSIGNQYYMDEYNGLFRIVTETQYRDIQYRSDDAEGKYEAEIFNKFVRNANLYCFEVGTWEQKAVVESFAPEGETVESVRFDGDFAYVCTAVVVTLTDPVFFFDMTNLNNIIVKDTGVIAGYSSSLIQLRDGLLLGIGYDDNSCLKVEVYEETETGVESICVYNRNVREFATEYKAYYIDRENNLFGIPTADGYVLLAFDGYQLFEYAVAEVTGFVNDTRGVVIDDYLYVFCDNFAVEKLV